MALSDVEIIDFPGFPTAVVRYRDQPMTQMPSAMDRAFGALGGAMAQGEFVPSGPAFSRHEVAPGETADFETGFPVDVALAAPITLGDVEIVPSELPACRLAIARYTGGYEGLGGAWGAFLTKVGELGTPGLPFWEAYQTQPTPQTDPDTLVTGLAIPISEER